ncbi:MAG: S8 family serine peptidase [Armatimonadota bacterium]
MKRKSILYFFISLLTLYLPLTCSSSRAAVNASASTSSDAVPRIPLETRIQNEPLFVPGRLLVKLLRGADPVSTFRDLGVEPVDRIPQVDTWIVKVPEGAELKTAGKLQKDIRVEYAEPDHYVHELLIPNDPLFSRQWHLSLVDCPGAWDIATGSSDIIIAILDTGIDLTHPEFTGKLVAGYNALTQTGSPVDNRGHGTHVAGIAAALTNNGIGVAGVSWGARIMPIKVLDTGGRGSDSTIARGINWAIDNGAKVINLSLGGTSYSNTVYNSVQRARRSGVLLFAAAGNDYLSGNPRLYPAAYDGVVAVGATDNLDRRASYSQTGDYIQFVAPGGDPYGDDDADPNHWITSTWRRASGTAYAMASGTSQSSPIAAGLAALIWSVKPDLSSDEVLEIMRSTAVDLGKPGWDPEYGYGRIDVGAALRAVGGTGTKNEMRAFITAPKPGEFISGIVGVHGKIEGSGIVSYRVQFGIGDNPKSWYDLASKNGVPPPEGVVAQWDTTQLVDGTYTLKLVASSAGGMSSESAPVSVVVDNTPPVAEVESPYTGSVISGIMDVTVKVKEPNLSAVAVQYGRGEAPSVWFDLEPVNSDNGVYRVTWDTFGLPGGTYTIRAIASDKAGNVGIAWSTVEVQTPVLGDIDGDSRVTVADAVLALRIALGVVESPPEILRVADLAPVENSTGSRGDGAITVADAVLILRMAVGIS